MTPALTDGLACMFESFHEINQAPEHIAVFKNLGEAEAWPTIRHPHGMRPLPGRFLRRADTADSGAAQ
jgi:hypothetical protein